MGIRKPKDANMISPKPNSKTNDHVARLRVVQEVSSRNSSASWNSSCTFSTEQSLQDQPRPPVYNVEDYAGSLRKFGKRGPTADKDNTAEPMKQTEMTLKEFTSTTELLEKLKADLKLAYFSFVQEFVGDPIDGITLLLELLKTIQQNGSQTKCTPANQRRITLDENSCLQCLKYCLRCQDAARKLAISSAGLYTLAASIMSTVNQSRLLTLELLTKACSESGTAEGHNTVSDAMSTMRLRFAEPVRFRFLVGMMSGNGGGSGMELLLAGLKFVNAFTETCPDLQTKFYVQAELKQAGFKPAAILKNISNKSPLLSSVSDEIYRWQKNFINVESLKRQHDEVVREAKSLREKVVMLEKKIHLLQDEKRVISSRIDHADGSLQKNKIEGGGGGNSAEDEGISSSEQDDCEEDVPSKKVNVSTYKMYNLCQDDTAVAKVLEGFDKVINDAGSSGRKGSSSTSSGGDVVMKRRSYHEYSDADDAVIIPAKIVPEPPRRSRSLFVNKNFEVNPFFEDDEESADSECAYEDEDEDDDGEEKSRLKRSETFRTVQNQIKRFSAMAMRHDDIRTGPPAEDKTGNEGRRKSLYNVFGRVPDSTDKPAVTRSASTRNVNDSSRIPVVRFDHCKSERRPVYLPAGGGGGPCRDANKEPKVFVARGHNNAGLYSGYKDTAAATVDETVITGAARTYKPGSNGLRTHRNVMSVSTGKLTDFPSGLY